MKYYYFAFIFLTVFMSGCKKDDSGSDPAMDQNCTKIQQVKITAEKTSFIVGDKIHLGINEQPDIALFNWKQTNDPNTISTDLDVDIDYAEKSDEGWYYLSVSYPDCDTHVDSIYISVKNDPVTAPCTPTNNIVIFSSIPDINPATINWSYNNTWNRRVLNADGAFGYPDFNIYFNTYWDTTEPEDGKYTITSMQDTDEYPPYTVHITSLYSSILFESSSGEVYVSHVNGKLRVTFCNVSLSGSNGSNSFTTTATGMLTAP